MNAENPYQTPRAAPVDVPDAPSPFGWQVDGKVVRVRDVSQFPMIDPFSGRSDDVMALQRVLVRHEPWHLLVGPLAGCGGLAMFVPNDGQPLALALAIRVLIGLLLGWLFFRVLARFRPTCLLRLFFGKWMLRIRVIGTRVLTWLFFAAVLGNVFAHRGPPWVECLPGLGFLCWLVGSLVMLLFSRRLRCRKRADGWWEIRGFHRRALARLAEEPECPESTGGDPNVVFLR